MSEKPWSYSDVPKVISVKKPKEISSEEINHLNNIKLNDKLWQFKFNKISHEKDWKNYNLVCMWNELNLPMSSDQLIETAKYVSKKIHEWKKHINGVLPTFNDFYRKIYLQVFPEKQAYEWDVKIGVPTWQSSITEDATVIWSGKNISTTEKLAKRKNNRTIELAGIKAEEKPRHNPKKKPNIPKIPNDEKLLAELK